MKLLRSCDIISSVANNASLYSGLRNPANAQAKAGLNAPGTSADSGAGDAVSISQDAKTKWASAQKFDFDFSYNNIDHSQADYQAHYAEGARRISAMHGLPEGQYDFTKISRDQAKVILSDMIMNRGVMIGKETIGLENYISSNADTLGRPIGSDIPQNAIDHITMQQVSFSDSDTNSFGVPEESLKWILSITRTAQTLN